MGMKNKKVSWWLFLVGMVGALILGILQGVDIIKVMNPVVIILMAAVGIAIGVINITNAESQRFMVAVLVLGGAAALISGLDLLSGMSKMLDAIFQNIANVALPAGMVVAIRSIYKDAR